MMGLIFRDINAPDTSWRPSNEDPIPVIFGRYPFTAFVYRWFACRPLDGHARSNATFRTAPTFFFTRTGSQLKRDDFTREVQRLGDDGGVETINEVDEIAYQNALKASAPWPKTWHMQPRWKQAMYTRLLPTAWFFSLVLVLWLGGWHALGGYLAWQWWHLAFPVLHFLWWAVTAWW